MDRRSIRGVNVLAVIGLVMVAGALVLALALAAAAARTTPPVTLRPHPELICGAPPGRPLTDDEFRRRRQAAHDLIALATYEASIEWTDDDGPPPDRTTT